MKSQIESSRPAAVAGRLLLSLILVLALGTTPADADTAKPRASAPSVGASSSGSSSSGSSSSGGASARSSGSSSRGAAVSRGSRSGSGGGRKAADTRRSIGRSIRHPRPGHIFRHYPYYPYYYSYYSPYYFGFGLRYGLAFYHPFYYPYGFGYWVPAAGDGYYYGSSYRRAGAYGLGGLDLNVRPKKAQVWVDGEYVGLVKEFDGWPDFLWLERGTYELAFFYPGLRTEVRRFRIHPGVVIDVELRMMPGESVPPEELMTAAPPPPRAAPAPPAEEEAARAADPALDLRGEPGRVRLSVEPADATLYLDGRFLGTGDELAQLHAGLLVSAGAHRLEALRPGFDSKELEFSVESGEEVELSVSLTPQ